MIKEDLIGPQTQFQEGLKERDPCLSGRWQAISIFMKPHFGVMYTHG